MKFYNEDSWICSTEAILKQRHCVFGEISWCTNRKLVFHTRTAARASKTGSGLSSEFTFGLISNSKINFSLCLCTEFTFALNVASASALCERPPTLNHQLTSFGVFLYCTYICSLQCSTLLIWLQFFLLSEYKVRVN